MNRARYVDNKRSEAAGVIEGFRNPKYDNDDAEDIIDRYSR